MDADVREVVDSLETRFWQVANRRRRAGAPFDTDSEAMEAGPESAGFLNLLIRTINAKAIVEVGTSFGYTALWLGEAARATGGYVIGTEAVESKHAQAVEDIARAGLAGTVEVRLGDAMEILDGIAGPIDLAFVDAWKSDYIDYFERLLPRMRMGGCIVADNMTSPAGSRPDARAYQAHVRALPNVKSQLLTIGSGLEMSVKTG